MRTFGRSRRSSKRRAASIRPWHLGDVVGYGPEPDEVVARLAEIGATGVRGNHDAAALGGREIELFNVDARRAMEWTREAITAPHARVAARPNRFGEPRVATRWSTAVPRDPIWEYITSTPVARANLALLETPYRALRSHPHPDRVPRRRPG